MTYDEDNIAVAEQVAAAPVPRSSTEAQLLADLIQLLLKNPAGLRRWSVMRAMRTELARTNRSIPHKLEDDVERVFRRYSASPGDAVSARQALFFRPGEKAGEVWAVHPEPAQAWLARTGSR